MTDNLDPRGVPDAPPLPPPSLDAMPPAPPAAHGLTRFPALAAFLSLVPGLGHLYVGAYQRAAMLLIGIIVVCIVTPLPISVFLALFLWFFGMFDAYRQAQLGNLRLRGECEPSEDASQANLAFGVFLTVVGGLLLLKKLELIDLDWLRDWWPLIPVLAGVYLIVSALLERQRRRPGAVDDGSGPEEP